jgi:hypothetical protein
MALAIVAAAPARAADVSAQIEGFGFDTCAGFGVGGMVIVQACPVVLFKDGQALRRVEGLAFEGGLAAHQAAKPQAWTSWRRRGAQIELLTPKGWDALAYPTVYRSLPAGYRLSGLFRSLRGAGTAATGGVQSVAAWGDYRFTPDGRVVRGGGAGASSTGAQGSVVTGSTRPGRPGRYRIDGFMLRIDYDDGSRESRVLIADPRDLAQRTLWLDGQAYVQRR